MAVNLVQGKDGIKEIKKQREMTLPNEKSQSISTAKAVVFNPHIPVVHSISGYGLEKLGWVKSGMTWAKDGESITYDGTHFRYKNQNIQFIEDIK